jgi:hypothetical protein
VGGSEHWHDETPQRWGATVFRRVAACVVSLLWLFLALSATLDGTPETATVVWIGEVVVVVGSWRLVFGPYVEAGADELIVKNGIKTMAIPWTRIKKITPGWGGLTILQTDGRVKTALGVQKANIAPWTNQSTRADDIASTLMDRVSAAGVFLDPQPGPIGGGRQWVAPPKSEGGTNPQR